MMTMLAAAQAADFNVTSPSVFSINGEDNNPPITLTRGQTYTFSISTAVDHPFQIVADNISFTPYNDGVVNNNINNGTLTFTVPMDAPNSLYYICSIHFFGGPITIVSGNMPPDVSITSPTNGAIFFGSSPIVVQATATDSDGSVTNVEFFDGAVSLGSDTTSPYSITNVFANGTHAITAVAKDNSGNSTTSAGVMFNVGAI